MQILHVRNPQALANPMLLKLFEDALTAIPDAAPGGVASCAQDIYACIANPDIITLVGVEEGAFTTLCVAVLPNNNIFPYPSIVIGYNVGSRETYRAVKARMLDTLLEKGYTHFRTANTSGHSDAAWEKVSSLDGYTLSQAGTLYDVKVG